MTTRARAAAADPRGPRRTDRGAAGRAWATFIGLALLSGLGCAFELADVLRPNDGVGGGQGTGDGGPNAGDGAEADAGAAADDAGSPRGQLLGAACPQIGAGKVVSRLAVTPSDIYATCNASTDVTRPEGGALVRRPSSGGIFATVTAVNARTIARLGASVVIAGDAFIGGSYVYGFFRPDGSLINPGNTGWVQIASTGNVVVASGYANSDGLWSFDTTSCVPPDGGRNGCATEIGYGGSTVGLAVPWPYVLHYGCDRGEAKLWVRTLDGAVKATPPVFVGSAGCTSSRIPLGVAAVAGQAYFALDADVLTCPLNVTSCAQQTYVAGEGSDVALVTADGKRPIWASGSRVRYANAPNTAQTLAESPGETITALVAEDGVAYWGTDMGNVYRRPLP